MSTSYAETTRNTKEPLKRLAHQGRLGGAAGMVPLRSTDLVLDYGCGDGAFFAELAKRVPTTNLYGYELYLLDQFDRHAFPDTDLSQVTTYERTDDLVSKHAGEFDVVFCMEVCEHLNQAALTVLFDTIRACSKHDATFVFGVPIETGLSGFVKNIYRTIRGGRQNATFGRALKSLVSGYIPRAHDRHGWIGSHIGFDTLYFREQLRYGGFEVVDMKYLPWPILSDFANNEVYLICRRNRDYGY